MSCRSTFRGQVGFSYGRGSPAGGEGLAGRSERVTREEQELQVELEFSDLDLRTTGAQKCAAVPMRAGI